MTQHEGAPDRSGSEADFRLDELFFSRTDPGGIIKAGNSVFQRVSEFEAHELWEKPHKLIRHRDTPRGVFYKLWDSLKAGRPICAYVKNRTKSGRYYWVYAVVAPIEGGYISVRLKPSSEIFDQISRFYITHAERERREKIEPAASAAMIEETLGELGFASYETFMSAALRREHAARDAGLGREPSPLNAGVDKLQTSARALSENIRAISASLESVKNTPFNLRIFASQLGTDGEGLAVVAANYVTLLDDLRAMLDEFDAAATQISSSMDDAMLLNVIVKLQREMVSFFRQDTSTLDGVDKALETRALENLSEEFSNREQAALRTIRDCCRLLPNACQQMKRQAAALDVIRLTAKVEVSSKNNHNGIILELEQRLEECQETLQAALKNIALESTQSLSAIREIMRLDEEVRRTEAEARAADLQEQALDLARAG